MSPLYGFLFLCVLAIAGLLYAGHLLDVDVQRFDAQCYAIGGTPVNGVCFARGVVLDVLQ